MDKLFQTEHSHNHEEKNEQKKVNVIDAKFILFLVKDGLHNLTDGIAIAAIY